MKALFIPLKREYYEAFVSGRKGNEYRKYGPRWNEKTCVIGRPVVLSLGYGKKNRAEGKVTAFAKTNQLTDDFKKCYGNTAPGTFMACIGIKLKRPLDTITLLH